MSTSLPNPEINVAVNAAVSEIADPLQTSSASSSSNTSATPANGLGMALLAGAAAALAACGGGSGSSPASPATPTTPSTPSTPPAPLASLYDNPNFPKATTDVEAARFLQRAGFAATDADITVLKTKSFGQYLESHFNAPLGQTGWDWLEQRGYGVSDVNSYFTNTYPADYMVWNQLLTGADTLRKRCALALSEYFVVSMQGSEFNWRSHAIAAYWDVLVAGSFGNFRDLLEEITLNAAMGNYLNTKGNLKEDPAKGRLPDENYSREVMQLFTLGIYLLNLDGTEKLDANGNRIETYTATDVAGLAKVFTGYEFDTTDDVRLPVVGQTYTITTRDFARKRMLLNPFNHSITASTFLGVTVPAGAKAEVALKIALDTLFNHANVAPFFAKQMIQRLVTSNPSPAYVSRVAAKFANNGSGVRGDLKAVWAAILTDDEALNPAGLSSNTFGKLREPIVRMVQWGRSFGIKSTANSWKIPDVSNVNNALGQSPLRSPSVFNFFRPGYVPPSTALATNKLTAPEFQLVTEVTVGSYLNNIQDLIRNGLNIGEPTLPQATGANMQRDITASYTAELALVGDATALVARLNLVLCAGRLSAANQALIVNALNANPITATSTPAQKLDRVAAAVLLVMASSEYLIQK
jgi:uncharacterized protein (DUF1800 family)